jgi:Arm DNA-binding domain
MLTKQAIDALVNRARATPGAQLELIDEREPGLRIRAGERSANWILNSRLRNGKRSRIKLGPWPAMTISHARASARDRKREIAEGVDPNAAKREAREAIARAAEQQVTIARLSNATQFSTCVSFDVERRHDALWMGRVGYYRNFLIATSEQ